MLFIFHILFSLPPSLLSALCFLWSLTMNRTNTRRIKQEPHGDIPVPSPLVHRQVSAVPQSPRSASTIMSDDDSIMTGAAPSMLGTRFHEELVASVHHPSASPRPFCTFFVLPARIMRSMTHIAQLLLHTLVHRAITSTKMR